MSKTDPFFDRASFINEFLPSPEWMPGVIARFQADYGSLDRRFTAPFSSKRLARFKAFYTEWQKALETLPFKTFSRSDRLDWLLFRNYLHARLRGLEIEGKRFLEMEPLIPFAADLIALEDARRELSDVDPQAAAEILDRVLAQFRQARQELEAKLDADKETGIRATVANRAAKALDQLCKMMESWFNFYHSFDPMFAWWVEKPYQAFQQEMLSGADFLRKRLAGAENQDAIIGDPIGREALLHELEASLIPYTPEELIAIARRERDWCEGELCRASQEIGFGDDWRAAVEHVKSLHEPPGGQPALARELAAEAAEYVESHDLVSVPAMAKESWRMEMMSPEEQKTSPFFLGGEVILVSFPTNTMEHAQKKMSLRGNNRHFSRAVVQHELIPGHRLQAFFMERSRPYRKLFSTPFWIEGWTLHWEMLLWELGFAQSPEDRIGMLFWRIHRSARILFSLGFHLGELSPQECVEMLVNDVGHERDNAIAEVRRSFSGEYDPLYQCAYLIGGLQVHALYKELVNSGRMTPREFHDAMLRENSIPIAALRALLLELPLERDFQGDWRFDEI